MHYQLRCVSCGKIYTPEEVDYVCKDCGDRLGTLEVLYDYSSITVKKSDFEWYAPLWQFEKLLPVEKDSYRTSLHVGGTPLYHLQGYMGLKEVLVKFDGSNPTASFKDRASAVAVTKAFEKGCDTVYCASTGNAASSLAGISAAAGLKAYIFVPASAPAAKIAQLFTYGARVIPVKGTYDEAFDLSLAVGKRKGWYCRNSAVNPHLLEGKKTGALEIIVQNKWRVPDVVLVGVGDGTVISSFYKGFYDFFRLGLIDRIPKIIGVQAQGSASIKLAFEKGEPYAPCDIKAKTVADSISVGMPRDVVKACKYVAASGGDFISVSDEEIMEAVREMAVQTGVFGEPAGAAAYAGLKKLVREGALDDSASACVVVTGNGLKDIKAVERFVDLRLVEPDLNKVLELVNELT